MSGANDTNTSPHLLTDLTRAKALFQQRAILAAMGVKPDDESVELPQCDICGDHHEEGEIPRECETGDGV